MKYLYNNFYELIERNASEYPKDIAYFIDDRKISWKILKNRVDSFARALEVMGVKRNDKIPLLINNSLEYVIAYYAIQKLCAVPVPINTFLKEDEIAYILNDIEAGMLLASSKLAKNIKNIRDKTKVKRIVWEGEAPVVDEDNISFEEVMLNSDPHESVELPKINDLAVIIYTSGTTGKPKRRNAYIQKHILKYFRG